MISVHVHFYAQLRDFFGDAFVLELPASSTIASLFENLSQKNALAADWIKVSRAASADAFLAPETALVSGAEYFILPPSSGG